MADLIGLPSAPDDAEWTARAPASRGGGPHNPGAPAPTPRHGLPPHRPPAGTCRANYKYSPPECHREGGVRIKSGGHKSLTALSLDLFDRIGTQLAFRGQRDLIVDGSAEVDRREDLELVMVRSWRFLGGRTDPHPGFWPLRLFNDVPSYRSNNIKPLKGVVPDLHWTALNHYIDVRAGQGDFDDYDGYSYGHGSARQDQHEVYAGRSEAGVDAMINIGLSGFYVHAPGHHWYKGCSESVRRYSRFSERTKYATLEDEARARFPPAEMPPRMDAGVPGSVFLPVDNIAKHWYDRLGRGNASECLGYVLHALQDAAVPHHAAACAGNFHTTYEDRQAEEVGRLVREAAFTSEALGLFQAWSANTSASPSGLSPGDHGKVPGIDWEVDMLTTWLAVNAFKEYRDTYRGFQGGTYVHDATSIRRLALLATAISMLVLAKADRKVRP